MARRTAQQATDRWVRKMQAATQDYQEGINSVQQAPGASAARNVAGYQNGVQQAVASGKWQRNVAAVPLDEWKRAALEKGSARLASGAAAAAPKVLAAQERNIQMVDSVKASIASMPRDTADARIARSQAFLQGMRKAAQSRGAR